MWGSDYPHKEASSPYSREAIALSFAGVPREETAQMLSGNAAKLYGFVKLRAAIQRQDWKAAAREIEDSRYFAQVKGRGVRNRDIMLSGHTTVAGIPVEEWSE